MNLTDLREARALKIAEARALLDKGELNDAGKAAFDKLKAEITALEADEQRAVFIEDSERRAMGQPDNKRKDFEAQATVIDAIRAQIENRAADGALAEFAQECKRNGIEPRKGGVLVPSSIFAETRATQTTTSQASIVPDDYRADQFIGLLRNSTIVRSLGARVLTGLRGDVVIPKATGASTAYWIGEGDALTESAPSYATIGLSPKHVGALTSFSRQLAQQSNPAIEQLLRDDIAQVVGVAVDKALIHGKAADKSPTGIIETAGIQTASLATMNWATVIAMVEKLQLENITPTAWLTHAKSATQLVTTLKSASAGSEFLLQNGRMAELPVFVTNQLEPKAGSPAKGRVILGDFSQIVIGEWGATELQANPYATGFYEKGAVQLRILHTMDAVIRHPKAFVLADDLGI